MQKLINTKFLKEIKDTAVIVLVFAQIFGLVIFSINPAKRRLISNTP